MQWQVSIEERRYEPRPGRSEKLVEHMRALWQSLACGLCRYRTMRALQALDDVALKDIGLDRGGIERAAAEVACCRRSSCGR